MLHGRLRSRLAARQPPHQSDLQRRKIDCLALPDNFNEPSQLVERGRLTAIPFGVCGQLRPPEGNVGRGLCGETAAGMLMPEAAMHEDDRPVLRQHDVWPARQHRVMEAVPVPHAMEQPPNRQLRPRVLPTDPRHHPASHLGAYDVGHAQILPRRAPRAPESLSLAKG